jgi:hypothetical protein
MGVANLIRERPSRRDYRKRRESRGGRAPRSAGAGSPARGDRRDLGGQARSTATPTADEILEVLRIAEEFGIKVATSSTSSRIKVADDGEA